MEVHIIHGELRKCHFTQQKVPFCEIQLPCPFQEEMWMWTPVEYTCVSSFWKTQKKDAFLTGTATFLFPSNQGIFFSVWKAFKIKLWKEKEKSQGGGLFHHYFVNNSLFALTRKEVMVKEHSVDLRSIL